MGYWFLNAYMASAIIKNTDINNPLSKRNLEVFSRTKGVFATRLINYPQIN